ncbi:hypothetical protein CKR_P24 (plasmid) [Clostridium kluyveri NBRC 12016]|uniref:Uncharacterized protein n=1 Tax=Clostridium kluyveri (strain NBRC 12016) TaxID=583346 RepID=B9E6G6_CLOK1|nr:hypothetical protein CKR_P24 [Clostridium kluyveri NBRC 12016]
MYLYAACMHVESSYPRIQNSYNADRNYALNFLESLLNLSWLHLPFPVLQYLCHLVVVKTKTEIMKHAIQQIKTLEITFYSFIKNYMMFHFNFCA